MHSKFTRLPTYSAHRVTPKLIYFYVNWQSPLTFCLLNNSYVFYILATLNCLCVLVLQQLHGLISVPSWTTNCLQFPYCDMQLTAHTKWQPRADNVPFWPSSSHLTFYQFQFSRSSSHLLNPQSLIPLASTQSVRVKSIASSLAFILRFCFNFVWNSLHSLIKFVSENLKFTILFIQTGC